MVPARRMALMIMPPSAAAALYRDRHIFFILNGIRYLRRTAIDNALATGAERCHYRLYSGIVLKQGSLLSLLGSVHGHLPFLAHVEPIDYSGSTLTFGQPSPSSRFD